jgi:hypothetical protein
MALSGRHRRDKARAATFVLRSLLAEGRIAGTPSANDCYSYRLLLECMQSLGVFVRELNACVKVVDGCKTFVVALKGEEGLPLCR